MPAGGVFLEAVRKSILGSVRRVGDPEKLKEEIRQATLRSLLERDADTSYRSQLARALEEAQKIMDEVSEGYKAVYGDVVDLAFQLADKGLVGTGSGLLTSVFEVGLNIDPLLGVPYYPGSTLKGVVRALASELIGENSTTVRVLFGSRNEVGALVFSDAYPMGCVRNGKHPCLILTGDVTTPHYFKPRRGIVEAEYEAQPTPIVSIAIAPETVFRVVVGIDKEQIKADSTKADEITREAAARGLLLRDKGEDKIDWNTRLALIIIRLVTAALSSGLAARSSKGYNILLPLGATRTIADQVDRNIVALKIIIRRQRGDKHGSRR